MASGNGHTHLTYVLWADAALTRASCTLSGTSLIWITLDMTKTVTRASQSGRSEQMTPREIKTVDMAFDLLTSERFTDRSALLEAI